MGSKKLSWHQQQQEQEQLHNIQILMHLFRASWCCRYCVCLRIRLVVGTWRRTFSLQRCAPKQDIYFQNRHFDQEDYAQALKRTTGPTGWELYRPSVIDPKQWKKHMKKHTPRESRQSHQYTWRETWRNRHRNTKPPTLRPPAHPFLF